MTDRECDKTKHDRDDEMNRRQKHDHAFHLNHTTALQFSHKEH